jgi:CDP-glycerol glycerophosphotransferase (TagB/SpsB family)
VQDLETVTEKYAAKRAAWKAKFTPYDDGSAAERVVRRIYDEGWLG